MYQQLHATSSTIYSGNLKFNQARKEISVQSMLSQLLGVMSALVTPRCSARTASAISDKSWGMNDGLGS